MITYLVVEKLAGEPGIYGSVNKKDDFRFKLSDALVFTPFFVPYLAYRAVDVVIKSGVGTTKLAKLYEYDKGVSERDQDISPNIGVIAVTSDSIDGEYGSFDDRIFNGIFLKEKHLEFVLPPKTDAQLFILTRKTAKELFTDSANIEYGLSVADESNKELIPIAEFSKKRWDNVASSIAYIFSRLGATSIEIKDVTDKSIDTKTRVGSEGAEQFALELAGELNYDFEMKETFDDSHYKPAQVKNMVNRLNDVPQIKRKAKDLIEKKRSGSFSFKEKLDAKFGMNINVMAVFSGIYKGGYSRDLQVKMEFK